MSGRNWDDVYASLTERTALEELLDWDVETVDFLFSAWALQSSILCSVDDESAIALMVGCLPAEKNNISQKLEQWLRDNYNINRR
jgi:hypothetical protein